MVNDEATHSEAEHNHPKSRKVTRPKAERDESEHALLRWGAA